MAKVATVVGLILFVIACLWGAYRWAKYRPGAHREEFPREFLIDLGKALGLDRYVERDYFGAKRQMLMGTFDELTVEFEISSGAWIPYLRLSIIFPKSLAQDVNIYSDDRTSVVSHIRRFREIEMGDAEFDRNFLLFARDPDRLNLYLSASLRDQMNRLFEEVGHLAVTDRSVFAFVDHPCDRREVKRILKKSLDLAQRLYRTADFVGPRAPERGAGHYDRAVPQDPRTERQESRTDRRADRPQTIPLE